MSFFGNNVNFGYVPNNLPYYTQINNSVPFSVQPVYIQNSFSSSTPTQARQITEVIGVTGDCPIGPLSRGPFYR